MSAKSGIFGIFSRTARAEQPNAKAEHTEHAAAEKPDDAGIWLTITELAKHTKTSKATVSERVSKLEDEGLVKPKPGKGKSKLVNLAEYESAVERTGDPAREQAAETKNETPDPEAEKSTRYRDAKARDAEHQAQLTEIKLGKELGRYIEIDQWKQAVEDSAEILLRIISRPLGKANELVAAAETGGINAVRVKLRAIIAEQRTAIAEAMQLLSDKPFDEPADLPAPYVEPDEQELPFAAIEQEQPEPESKTCASDSGTPLAP